VGRLLSLKKFRKKRGSSNLGRKKLTASHCPGGPSSSKGRTKPFTTEREDGRTGRERADKGEAIEKGGLRKEGGNLKGVTTCHLGALGARQWKIWVGRTGEKKQRKKKSQGYQLPEPLEGG